MVLSKRTLDILRNFSGIENSIYIDEPSVLKIRNAEGTIIAVADIEEEFPEFGIYNFSSFVQALSMFESPKLQFKEDKILLKEGRRKITYKTSPGELIENKCKESTVFKALEKEKPNASVSIKEKDITDLLKLARVLQAEVLCVDIKESEATLTAKSMKLEKSGDTYSFETDECEGEASAQILIENLQLIPGDYRLELYENKRAIFRNTNGKIFYIVALYVG